MKHRHSFEVGHFERETLTSQQAANFHGKQQERWIYVLVCADCHGVWDQPVPPPADHLAFRGPT